MYNVIVGDKNRLFWHPFNIEYLIKQQHFNE